MYSQSRRRLMATIIVITGVMAIFLYNALAADLCSVQHPLKPADKAFGGRCNNCGMARAMWARTWKDFENSKGRFEVCSFTCLAKFAVKSGEIPVNVKVALYNEPQTMVAAQDAHYVVGSKAKGTMTKTSKLAFATQQAAQGFAGACGGEAMGFQETFELAKQGAK
jgi:copper chaperone NosL